MSLKIVDPKHLNEKEIEEINALIKGANTVVIAVEKDSRYYWAKYNMTVQEAVFLCTLVSNKFVSELAW